MKTIKRPLIWIAILSVVFIYWQNTEIWAAEPCNAVAVYRVSAFENADSILQREDILTHVSQYNVNKLNGRAEICSHGGYCYAAEIVRKGSIVEALHLLNCSVGPQYDEDEEYTYYSLQLIRSTMGDKALVRNDILGQLSDLGLCSACADNVANYLMSKPNSRCTRLAKKALNGNENAIDVLVSNPDYCVWNY